MGKDQSGAGKTILVADDDPSIVATVSTYLTSLGYTVEGVANGKEAIEAIDRARPDLAILDIAMPEASGIVVTRHVRSHPDESLRQLPIIMLTARSDTRHEAYSDEAGVNAFLPKPVTLQELAEKVKELL